MAETGKAGGMEYTYLGRSGLLVSKLCLGTMNFGPVTNEDDSHTIMSAALDAGITFFDTANVYGWDQRGLTEEIIGRWFAADQSRRDRVVLATKVYGAMSDAPDAKGVSARNIIRECEASLRRLQTDRIDLYQMHHIDRNTPWEEIWQAYETLVAQGKVLYAGSSNFAGWHIAQAQEAARQRNFLGLVSEQSLYNLVERSIELEVLPACQAYGLGVIPWSPLHGGVLGGVLSRQDRKRSDEGRSAKFISEHREQIEAYEALAGELDVDPANLALAWLLHQPGVTAPIIGPRTLDQLNGALAAVEISLEEKTLAKLDELFPGPGGPAPEAYAW